MGFKCGIVGLPNVGKSTLFNALTNSSKAQAGNFPFCTIEPNVGVVPVLDERLDKLFEISKSKKFFGYKKNPVWGAEYFEEISKCNMGINITRGKPIKYYSSERMATLLGNGILTFEHKDYQYQDFFNQNEMIFFDNANDLNSKILFYKKNNKLRKKIARNGYKKAHKIFNNKIIAEFMVKKTLGEKITNKQVWHDG